MNADPHAAEQWRRLREIFSHASTLAGQTQADYVQSVTASDPELRAEVEKLLRAVSRAGDALEVPLIDQISREAQDEHDPLLGAEISHYRVMRLINTGGYSRIYEAQRADGLFQRQVALKVADREPGGKTVKRDRLKSELAILAELTHPNICRLFDAGTYDDYLIGVLEYAQGGRLLSYSDRSDLSIPQRLQLFLQLCEAVRFLHDNGWLHCDLKPGNVLVRRDGSVCLIDFGSSRKVSQKPGPSPDLPDAITFTYASPELVSSRTSTYASEVYALGMILYEMLTGQYAYERKDKLLQDLIDSIHYDEVVPPSSKVAAKHAEEKIRNADRIYSQLSSGLDDVVLMALQKDPADRHQSVAALAADVRVCLSGRRPAAGAFMEEKRTAGVTLPYPLRVFLSHCSEDKRRVRFLRDQLRELQVRPWLDEDDILPGELWRNAVQSGLRHADVVLVCLSNVFVDKIGYFRRELQFALDSAAERPREEIYLIPVRLEDCDIPEELRPYQWVNLHDNGGFPRLVHALRTRCQQLVQDADKRSKRLSQ